MVDWAGAQKGIRGALWLFRHQPEQWPPLTCKTSSVIWRACSEARNLMRVPSAKVMSLRLGVGSNVPAYNTSPGRVLLAGQGEPALQHYLNIAELKPYTPRTLTTEVALRPALDAVRMQGYAWVDGEFDASFCGLSVPIRDDNGDVAAALSVNLLSGETTEAKALKAWPSPMREAAERLRAMAPSFLGSVALSTAR